jgi:hypothetical protein
MEEKMTEKKYRKTVKRLGGIITPSCIVDFPDTFRIKNKRGAINLLNIILYANDDTIGNYTVNLDTPLEKLKAAIKRG